MIYPIGNNVVLKKLNPEDVSSGGVIMPDTTQEGTIKAEVIAVGPGILLISGSRGNMQCKVGDTVVLPKHGAKKVELEGEDYIVIAENDLLTIIGE